MNWLPGMPSVSSAGWIGRIVSARRALDEGRHPPAVDDVDPGVRAGQEVVGHEAGQRQDVGERRPVAERREVGLERDARPAHRVAALAPDRDDRHVTRVVDDVAGHEPDDVRVERPGQRPVGRDQDDQPLAVRSGRPAAGGPPGRARPPGRPGPRRASRCTAGRPASRPGRASASLAATNCIARVIWRMFRTAPIRRRISRWLADAGSLLPRPPGQESSRDRP